MSNGKMKAFKLFLLVMIGLVGVLSVSAATIPVVVQEVQVEGTTVSPGDINRLDLERGQNIAVRVTLYSPVDLANVEVSGFVSGYEHNDVEPISDTSNVFDMTANVLYVKKFQLSLPVRVETDDYLLRVLVSDRNSEAQVQNYQLRVDAARHLLEIRDVVFNPQDQVQSGRALLTTVRVKNLGDKDEDSVKITISVPKLGISASDFIDSLNAGESTSSEELFMRVPECADAGTYDVLVTAEYNDGFTRVTKKGTITVVGQGCTVVGQPEQPPQSQVKTTIAYSPDAQALTAGASGVAYPITITNGATTAQAFTLSASGADWADVRYSPSNVVVIGSGETKTVYVYVAAKEDASVGDKLFAVAVKDSNGKSLQELQLKATVAQSGMDWGNVKNGLQIVLVVVVALLIVVALVFAFNKMKGSDEETKGQTYY